MKDIMTAVEQPEMSPLTAETIEAGYVSALMDLWLEQQSVGLNPYPHSRGAPLRGFLYSLKKEKAKHAREMFEDRAIGKLNDGYSPEEYHQLCSRSLSKDSCLGQWLRTRLDIQLLHSCVLHDESTCLSELPDLFIQQLGGEEGEGSWTPCVIMAITESKTLEIRHTDYTGILYHKDPIFCPVASLAMYFFWRFEMTNELSPNFNSRQSWYNTKLILGQRQTTSIAYPTQAQWVQRAFCDAGIYSSKVTHMMRGASTRMADAEGISEDQVYTFLRKKEGEKA